VDPGQLVEFINVTREHYPRIARIGLTEADRNPLAGFQKRDQFAESPPAVRRRRGYLLEYASII
jgi:hypothetical protein